MLQGSRQVCHAAHPAARASCSAPNQPSCTKTSVAICLEGPRLWRCTCCCHTSATAAAALSEVAAQQLTHSSALHVQYTQPDGWCGSNASSTHRVQRNKPTTLPICLARPRLQQRSHCCCTQELARSSSMGVPNCCCCLPAAA